MLFLAGRKKKFVATLWQPCQTYDSLTQPFDTVPLRLLRHQQQGCLEEVEVVVEAN